MFPHLISIPILAEITGRKAKQLRKMYSQILVNDCIPLTVIPFTQQEAFVKDYLLRSRYVDIDLMQCVTSDDSLPYLSAGVQQFFRRSNLVRTTLSIQSAYAADRTVTDRLAEFASSNGISYRTLMRERSRFMSHTSLMNLLSDPNKGEDKLALQRVPNPLYDIAGVQYSRNGWFYKERILKQSVFTFTFKKGEKKGSKAVNPTPCFYMSAPMLFYSICVKLTHVILLSRSKESLTAYKISGTAAANTKRRTHPVFSGHSRLPQLSVPPDNSETPALPWIC